MVGGARAVARCDTLGVAPYSDMADGLYRGYLTPAYAEAQRAVGDWMVEAGMTIWRDPAANLVGRYEGEADGPALIIGSHLDSVRDGGRYDGPLGIMLGIECVAALHAAGRRTPFPIEVYAFGDEEGSRFPTAMLTSRAVAGTLDTAMLNVADADGVTLGEALVAFLEGHGSTDFFRVVPAKAGTHGYKRSMTGHTVDVSPSMGPGFRRDDGRTGLPKFTDARHSAALAYLEAHIEQGPVLEAAGLPVGTVTGIAAQLRYAVTVIGRAGHAGTTAMTLRKDALAAAAEMISAAELVAGSGTTDLVATVGKLKVAPGAANVVPGRVDFTLDVRAGIDADRDRAADTILAHIRAIAEARDIEIRIALLQDLAASPCDPALIALMDASIAAQGIAPFRLVSGAGHDAMIMAALCPAAMLFVRCRAGISHNPAEHVDPADAEVALQVMLGFIDRLAERARA
jgi:allantoate deiminase